MEEQPWKQIYADKEIAVLKTIAEHHVHSYIRALKIGKRVKH